MSKKTTAPCPNAAEHTPQPEGYIAWHSWADEMYRTGHRQRRCPGCGLYAIWEGMKPNASVRDNERTCLNAIPGLIPGRRSR